MNHRKSVLVVGGGRGIGRSIVELLDAEGHPLMVVDCDMLALNTLAEHVRKYVLDITDRPAVMNFFHQLRQESASFHSVIISVGIHSTYPAEFIPDEVIDRTLDVNFAAHVRLVRELIPFLGSGSKIIGISSIGATLGIPMSSIYSASKGALELFYESLAAELMYKKINPIIVQPGNVNTGFNETGNLYHPTGNKVVDLNYAAVVSRIDSRRGISPMTVAKVVRKALNAERPRLCYIVGLNAFLAFWCRRLLGREIANRLMSLYFNIQS